MISGTLILLSVITLLLGYFLFLRDKWKNCPPGPKRYPLVGNLLQLEKLLYKAYCRWADEFGPIMRVDLANLRSVVISDPKMLKEIFSDSASTGRQDFSKFDIAPEDKKMHGLIGTEGSHWEELRRFTLRQLRDFGFGKNSMEESIMTEVTELIEIIKSRGNKPVEDIKERLLFAVVNSLWFIVTGKRHSHNDEALLAMTRQQHQTFQDTAEKGSIITFVPWIADVFPNWSGYAKLRESMENFATYFKKPIAEHMKTYTDDYQRDFIDVYLKEANNTKDPDSAFYGKFGEDNLLGILNDLYLAGTDTTSSTLSFMILYLSKMPEIQKKLQNEIEAVTGNIRPISVADRPKMPFAEAVIAETLRFSSIVPIGVNHRSLKDMEFKGYSIPKDTLITPNVYHIHHNPQFWGDPENFRPERFLSPDGTTFQKNEALIPFSVGRRQCLGETLARDSLFLFSTNIFQRFSVEFDKNGPDNGWESEVVFLLTPKPFQVFFIDRLE